MHLCEPVLLGLFACSSGGRWVPAHLIVIAVHLASMWIPSMWILKLSTQPLKQHWNDLDPVLTMRACDAIASLAREPADGRDQQENCCFSWSYIHAEAAIPFIFLSTYSTTMSYQYVQGWTTRSALKCLKCACLMMRHTTPMHRHAMPMILRQGPLEMRLASVHAAGPCAFVRALRVLIFLPRPARWRVDVHPARRWPRPVGIPGAWAAISGGISRRASAGPGGTGRSRSRSARWR